MIRAGFFVCLVLASGSGYAAAPLDVLVTAYPDGIAARAGNVLVFKDGARMDAGGVERDKPFERLLRDASILDQFRLAYPRGAAILPPARDFDPGRFRNEAFFDKLYGDCRKGGVTPNLVSIAWLPKSWGHAIMVSGENGVAEHLRAVSTEIDALPAPIRRAAYPIAGTYNCRPVKDTGRLSMHSYGAAIDLNLGYSNYWLWDSHGAADVPYRNRMPRGIVDAFERHGFIWGGRWYHYDTMHFEYRPELLQ